MAHDQINLQTNPTSVPVGAGMPDPTMDWLTAIDQAQRDELMQAMAAQAQMQMWAQAQMMMGQQMPQASTQVGGGPDAVGKGMGKGNGNGNSNSQEVPWGILKKLPDDIQQMLMSRANGGGQQPGGAPMAGGGAPMAGGMQQPLNTQAILTQMGSPLS